MTGYAVLATAWALFSGPTRYVSLATVAFFGIGAYAVAVLAERCRGRWSCSSPRCVGLALALSSASPRCASPASTS